MYICFYQENLEIFETLSSPGGTAEKHDFFAQLLLLDLWVCNTNCIFQLQKNQQNQKKSKNRFFCTASSFGSLGVCVCVKYNLL